MFEVFKLIWEYFPKMTHFEYEKRHKGCWLTLYFDEQPNDTLGKFSKIDKAIFRSGFDPKCNFMVTWGLNAPI